MTRIYTGVGRHTPIKKQLLFAMWCVGVALLIVVLLCKVWAK